MTWTIDPSVPAGIARAAAAARTFGSGARVLGLGLDAKATLSLIADTLGVDPEERDAAVVDRSLRARLADPVEIPPSLAPLGPLGFSERDASLALHEGVDLLRLRLAAFDGDAQVRRGPSAIRIWSRFPTTADVEAGRGIEFDVSFRLARGVLWSGGTLRMSGADYPATMADAIPGRPATDLLDHPWHGWRDLRAVQAQTGGGSLSVRLDHAKAA
jgi:hypothetical protein